MSGSALTASTTYPLAPDVLPTTREPAVIVCEVANCNWVNICTSKTCKRYLSSALPNVVSGSCTCSIEDTRAYPITLPAAVPGVDVNVSFNSRVWYALAIVEPEQFKNPYTFSTLE